MILAFPQDRLTRSSLAPESKRALTEKILTEQDEENLLAFGVSVTNNYIVNKVYVKNPDDAAYVLRNLLPPEREESSAMSEDDMLQVIHEHLHKLNGHLQRLHARMTERFDRMDKLEEKANA